MQEYNRWEHDQQQPYDTREWPGRDRGGQMYGGGREYSGRDFDRERGGQYRGRSEQYPSERSSNAGWGGDDRTSMRRDYEREVRGNDAGYRSAGYGSRESESSGYGPGYGGGYSGSQGYSSEGYGMRSQGGNRTRSEGGMNSGQYGQSGGPYGGQYGQDRYSSQGTGGGQYGGNRGYGSSYGAGQAYGSQGNQNWGSNQGYGGQSSGYGAQHFGSQSYADQGYGNEYGGTRGSSGYGSSYGGGSGYGGMQGGQYSGQHSNQGFGRQTGIGSAVDEGYRGYQSSRSDGGMGQQWNQGQRGSAFGKGPKNYQRSDSRIEEDVNDRLTQADEIDASDIEVKVSECEVTLTGTVSDRSDKFRAEQIAESVFGVKDVNNQIKVKKSGGMGRSSSFDEESGSQKSKSSSGSNANGGSSSQKQGSQAEQKRSTFAST